MPRWSSTRVASCPYGTAAPSRPVRTWSISATSLPARLCRLEHRKGRLAPGMDADILAVAGDPLTDPAALLDVRAVFREGHRVR
nr:amidohydrolase family protein [Planotetraspora mira]